MVRKYYIQKFCFIFLLTKLCCYLVAAHDGKLKTVNVSAKTYRQEKAKEKELRHAVELLKNSDTYSDGIKFLQKFSKSKDKWLKYSAQAMLADIYLKSNQLDNAWNLVKKSANYANLGEMQNKDAGSAYMHCFVLAARCLAQKGNSRDAFKMLSFVENKAVGYDKVRVFITYAWTLFDLDNASQSEIYLTKARKMIRTHLEEISRLAPGQAKQLDTGVSLWLQLQNEIDDLCMEIEISKLRKQYGKDYADYVKMRKLYNCGKYIDALELCKNISGEEESIYKESARLYEAYCIWHNNNSTVPKEKRLKKVVKLLKKFIKDKPLGLYRGEAWMAIGKIAMEENWESREAANAYSAALKWFRCIRENRDASDLYALPDKVKEVAKPRGKAVYFDKWKRLNYRKIDEKEIINRNTAPWYINEQEKECIFRLGFLVFANGKTSEAKKYWEKIDSYFPEFISMDPRLPNVHTRLLRACKLNCMAFFSEEKKKIESNMRLPIQYAEFLILLSKFDDANKMFQKIFNISKENKTKALAMLGQGISIEIQFAENSKSRAAKCFNWILEKKDFQREPFYGRALMEYGKSLQGISNATDEALKIFNKYCKLYPTGRYIQEARYRLACCYLKKNNLSKAESIYSAMPQKNNDNAYFLRLRINDYKKQNKEM